MKTLLTIIGLLLIGWLLSDAIIAAIDRDFEYRERRAVSARVDQCGPEYRQQYEDAIARIGTTNGYWIVHEPDCTMKVKKMF